MREIATSAGHTFWLLQQLEPLPPAAPFEGRYFACLLWDSGGTRTIEQRHLFVVALIAPPSWPDAWRTAARSRTSWPR
jgi:hypothetical protein